VVAKVDEARQVVARRLLPVLPGEQTPTTAELATAAVAGFGTIQAALRSLESDGIIELTTHGRQGTRLVRRNLASLWSATGRGTLTGVLPLPLTREFAGLATALTLVAEGANLPLQLLFRQGNTVRLESLRNSRADFTVMSVQAANAERDDVSHRELGPNSFYAANAVVVITAAGRMPDPQGRVPIDRSSIDHMVLTRAEFPYADLVDAPYLSIPDLVVSGAVDAAVWHQTSSSPLLTATGLAIHELHNPSPAGDDNLSRAALVWRSDDPSVAVVLEDLFDPNRIQDLQREVITGARAPQY